MLLTDDYHKFSTKNRQGHVDLKFVFSDLLFKKNYLGSLALPLSCLHSGKVYIFKRH